jgi:hypothetical protein
MEPRLPAQLEVGALIRLVEAAGGFATVLRKGERDGGTILVVLTEKGGNTRVFERMPRPDGTREWCLAKAEDPENRQEIQEWLARRGNQDPDLWIVELDIVNGERFIRSG